MKHKCYDDQNKLTLNTTNLALPTGLAQEFFFQSARGEAPSEMRSEQIFQATNYVSYGFLLSRVLRF